jgi:6-phosphogluconolactonase (cycloisomerase 2 family)
MSRRVTIALLLLAVGIAASGILAVSFRSAGETGSLPAAVLKAVIEPELVSSEPWPDIDWQCLLPDDTVYAASREEALQARAAALDRRTVDADRAPVRTIWDNRATYSAVAIDPKHNELVLQDENLFQILVYGGGDNTPPQASMSEPKRRIGGLQTKIEFNCGLYVDPATGDIYSVPNDTVDTLVIFGRNAEGNVKPDRELRTPHGTYAIAVDEERQEMFLTVQHDNAVVVYRKAASGQEKPLREIDGPATQLEDPHGVVVDAKRKLMFVANYGNARTSERNSSGRFEPPSITVYPIDANGDVAPLRIIEGDKTQLNWPANMAYNQEAGEMYVANDGGHSVLVFHADDSGNVAPRRVISGPKTNLKNPTGIAVDLKAREVVVSNFGNHAATVYPLNASGDVAPIRMIRAAPQNEEAMGIGNPGAVAYDTKREEILVPN